MAPLSGSIHYNNGNLPEKKILHKQECEEISYFGGLLKLPKFKTEILWPPVIFFVIIHLIAFYGLYIVIKMLFLLEFKPLFTSIYMYWVSRLGGYGVTVGAHRLWTHRSFKARRPLRILLIIMHTMAGQNSCYSWILDHRQHHKYSDTDADPHNATRGLFFCHMGWLMLRKHPEARAKKKTVFMTDIQNDPVVMFQKRYYLKMFLIFGVIIPCAIPVYLWNEKLWIVVVFMFTRYVVLLHITWTVNSLAHFYGNKPYDKSLIPTENKFVAFLTSGEGWHNYHHAFPWDYKAAEYGRDFNHSAALIRFFERIGWAYDLKEATYDIVMKTIYKKGDGSHELAEDVVSQKNSEIKHPTPGIEQLSMGW